jgi:hypothetical protein
MPHTLHITNGDSAAGGIRAADASGVIVPWRDILHEGPVPAKLSLSDLGRVRAKFLSSDGFGSLEDLQREFAERDDTLRRYGDFDEVVLWFEWDLYDQLQLIQILDFFSSTSGDPSAEGAQRVSLVCIGGYLGLLDADAFPELYASRRPVSSEILSIASQAWAAFRSEDPRDVQRMAESHIEPMEFLRGALERHLEEFPSTFNGLSRSESQILEAIAQGPRTFAEIFKQVSTREERIFCGDATMARYIERMSLHPNPLLTYPTGDSIDAPRTEEDSRAFRNAQMALTKAGVDVLRGDLDWIRLGGTDRWLGGVHLDGSQCRWRWNRDTREIVEMSEAPEA